METVLERIRANEAFQTEHREAHELGKERYRHDSDTPRQEAEESARQVSEATAAARARTMPLVLASVDTKLISKLETFSGKDGEWPRWSFTLRACLGLLKIQDKVWIVSTSNLETTCLDALLCFMLTMHLKEMLMEKVETVECSERFVEIARD